MDIEHKFAQLSGARLHYVEAGCGEPILLLHGFPDFWFGWRFQIPALSETHRVIAPDNRGHNLSSKPAKVSDYQVLHAVHDVRELIDQLGLGPVTLVGHDWGGIIGWNLAALYPECVARLIIINAPHPTLFSSKFVDDEAQREASSYLSFYSQPGAEALIEANDYEPLWERSFGRPELARNVSEADRDTYVAAWSRPGALTASLNWYRAAWEPIPLHLLPDDRVGRLSAMTIEVPTRVIWSMNSHALRPVLLDGLEDLVADLIIERLNDVGHFLLQDDPDLANAAIRRALVS